MTDETTPNPPPPVPPLGLSPEAAALKPPPARSVTPAPAEMPSESGGPKGLEPTRYGDWERKGRCSDF